MKGYFIVFLLLAGLLAKLGVGEDGFPVSFEFHICTNMCWDDFKRCRASYADGRSTSGDPPCWPVLQVCEDACEESADIND
ncbi:hypothetical protein LSAT2_008287 [Lamellibrachia satsuma]|nr:hypothetical protein LSAT2_008287 [Lamellibrachia satsuma]